MTIVGHRDVREKLKLMREVGGGGRVPPSLLFSGPQGIGKRRVALEFAHAITGETRAIDLAQPLSQTDSIFYVSPDGSQIKIDQVRETLRFLSLARAGQPLVLIFNDAHLINPQAANALLKSVEEPPPGVHFVFVVPSAALMLATIRSRSQVVRFSPLSNDEVKQVLLQLEETKNAKIESWVLEIAAGSVGTAIEVLQAANEVSSMAPLVDDLLSACAPGAMAGARTEALAALREGAKDRDLQAMALRFLVRRIGEAWRARSSERGAKPAKGGGLWLSQLPYEKLEAATDLALEAETDLSRNVDRQLLWESFASRLSSLVQ